MEVKEILKQMTLSEKIRICSGGSCWETKAFDQYGIPSVWVSDGPHGLRKQEAAADMLGINEAVPATCFPAASLTGCSWDPELTGEIGKAIAEEALQNQVSTILGPGANIKRNPLCGRNFEYYSEDPYLTGKMAAGFIRGIQEKGVGASLKHFAANNQEHKRFGSDSILDERTLREIYLTGFEIAVKEADPATVMCAYNRLNGIHCSNSSFLLTEILREEWGFDGMVITDWGAVHDRIQAFEAGCDLVMPGGAAFMEQEALEAVQSGALSEEKVTGCAERVLNFVNRVCGAGQKTQNCDMEQHHALARRAAEESAVLLKNDGILPLRENARAVLIGLMADQPRYQGAGSSHINPTRVISLTDALPELRYAPGCGEKGNTTPELLKQAEELAKNAEVVILSVGLPASSESEGYDRSDMKMPDGHLALIETVTSVNPNTIVLLYSGSPVEMPWLEKARAVLYMGLPGQAGGEAAADLLYGRSNPCGKLAESWPVKYDDCVSSSWYGEKNACYREGIYVGYRYYDKTEKSVCFPFGFGLSYTEFSYQNPSREGKMVSVEVTNIGSSEGTEIVQLYIAPKSPGLYRPVRELKGFAKLQLQPGETGKAVFSLDERSFALWKDGWMVPEGEYEIQFGSSSREIQQAIRITVPGVCAAAPEWQSGSWYENVRGIPSQLEWETMLGHPVQPEEVIKGQFTMNNSVYEMKDSALIMKLIYRLMERMVAKQYNHGKVDYSVPEFRMTMLGSADCSISGIINNALYRNYLLQGALTMANGHFFRGLRLMFKKFQEPEG